MHAKTKRFDINSLSTLSNLELAWLRINTAKNFAYKRHYRNLYNFYQMGMRSNLQDLRARIRGKIFEPSECLRVYYAKNAQFQRPISFLKLEDQIVYQGFANLIAEKIRDDRKKLERETVFSHLLSAKSDDIFFFDDWRECYQSFQFQCHNLYQMGFKWVADIDLTAFYELIPHDLVLRVLFPYGRDGELRKLFQNCLRTWSARTKGERRAVGIPQGPIASSLLAEAVLLKIDLAIKNKFAAIRYADDFRIFGESEREVREAAQRIEILLRESGLIPQTSKFKVSKIKSADELYKFLPSKTEPQREMESSKFISSRTIERSEAELNIRESVVGGKIENRSLFRYTIFRAQESPAILETCKLVLNNNPDQIDAIIAYFELFPDRDDVFNSIRMVLGHTQNEYIRGEVWKALGRRIPSMSGFRVRRLLDEAKEELKSRQTRSYNAMGIVSFLCRAESEGYGNYSAFMGFVKESLFKSFVANSIPWKSLNPRSSAVKHILKSKSFEPTMSMGEAFISSGREVDEVFGEDVQLPRQTLNVFRNLGLLEFDDKKIEPISEILNKRFKTKYFHDFKEFLGSRAYLHCFKMLSFADGIFDSGRSQWLANINSFNDALVRAFIEALRVRGLSGGTHALFTKKGAINDYGNLLDPKQKFPKNYPGIAGPFQKVHTRRCKLPDAHAYDKRTGSETSYLRAAEQRKLVRELVTGYRVYVESARKILEVPRQLK